MTQLPIILLCLAYFALRLFYCDHMPMWDGLDYYQTIIFAQAKPFDILNYSGEHNAQIWLLLIGLPNYIFPGSFFAYHAWVALLGAGGVAAFYFILEALFKNTFDTTERLLLTALFAFHPSLLSNQVQVTLDTGLLLFWLWFLLALLKDKIWLAALAGCGMLFSKETAIAHLPIVFLFCTLLQPKESRIACAKRYTAAIAAPVALLALFLWYKGIWRHEDLFFQGFLQEHSDLLFILPDTSLINYTLIALVLNFDWVFILLGAVLITCLYRMPPTDFWLQHKRKSLAFAWLFVSTLAVVIGVRHWAHVRYLLPFFPAMLLGFAYLLPTVQTKNIRLGIIAILLVLCGWQDVRTIDPVSNAIFCTTTFGTHNIIDIETQETCKLNERTAWLPRNMIYNLEFAYVPELVDRIMKDVRPTDHTVVIVQKRYEFELLTPFDADGNPTLVNAVMHPKTKALDSPKDMGQASFWKGLPDTVYYIEFPTPDNDVYRQQFAAHYAHKTEKIYDSNGYQLTLFKYENKR